MHKRLRVSGWGMGLTAVGTIALITLIALNSRPRITLNTRSPAAQNLTTKATSQTLSMEERRAIARGKTALLDSQGQSIALAAPNFDWEYIERNRNPLRVSGRKGTRAGREEMLHFMRTYPGSSIPLQARRDAYELLQEQLQALSGDDQRALANNTWEALGPDPIIGEEMRGFAINASGRTTAVVIHPQNPNIVYIGGAQGGVWKTTNGGDSWVSLTDDQPTLAVGTLALDPSHPDIIYVGTGEPHGSDSYYGLGILKSADGGQTWAALGVDTFIGLAISNIAIDPTNTNLIYVSVGLPNNVNEPNHPQQGTPGVYRSTNGGQSWELLASACGNGCAGSSALVLHPNNPQTIYAAFDGYGVYQSTNGGNNWGQLLGLASAFGRVELVISPSDSQILYAGFEEYTQNGSVGTIYKSTNGGNNWTYLNTLQYSYCGEQCSYDNILAIHPTNPDILLAGGQALYSNGVPGIDGTVFRTGNGGQSWSFNSGTSLNTTIHPDLHAITFTPSDPNIVWIGNDGGVYRSADGGQTWQQRNNNLGTLQFQSVALHPTDPNILFGGMQDNSKTKSTDSGQNWQGLDAGDGGYTAIDPFEPRFWYGTRYSSSGQIMQFQRNDNAGSPNSDTWVQKSNGINVNDRVLFYAPLATDPNIPGRVYWGTHRLYRSDNRGEVWQPISPDVTKAVSGLSAISTIAVMEGNSNIILVGTADGNVVLTRNGGGGWLNLTQAPLPNRWVGDVAIVDAQTFVVGFSGFAANTPTTPGHVYISTDGGDSWRDISHTGQSNGLPDLPVLTIAVDPDDSNIIYAGTDFGVYRTIDGGQNWGPFNQNLPLVAVFDMALGKYPNGTKQLVVGTHGRSIWRLPLSDTSPGGDNAYLPYISKNAQPGTNPNPTATPTSSAPTPTTPASTPTPTATAPSPTATPTQPAGLPDVPNGDFEQGANGDWTEFSSNGFGLIVDGGLPVNPRSGNWVAWLGGADLEESDLSQELFLPDAPAIYLHFYYQVISDETSCSFDVAQVLLNGAVAAELGLCQSENTSDWTAVALDISSYAGNSVLVEFKASTDDSVSSSFLIDDVSLETTP